MHANRDQAATPQDPGQEQTAFQHITDLPPRLLAMILTQCTDKKALRLTCRLFQQTLDNSMTCIGIAAGFKDEHGVSKLLQRTHSMYNLRAVSISPGFWTADVLLKHMPTQITTLRLAGCGLDLKQLARLPSLISLDLVEVGLWSKAQGIEHISGLTRLRCGCPVGSVGHLAPTLKHISILHYDFVQDIHLLTQLEYLQLQVALPRDFFQTHRQLPLKHICLDMQQSSNFMIDKEAWDLAPTTLTGLSLLNAFECKLLPGVLPTTITHLKLILIAEADIYTVAAALPWIRSLDICTYVDVLRNLGDRGFGSLEQFTNLQSLDIRSIALYQGRWSYDHCPLILSTLPQAAEAVKPGLKVNIIENDDEFFLVFGYGYVGKSAWVQYG